jgi:hypothetical protein
MLPAKSQSGTGPAPSSGDVFSGVKVRFLLPDHAHPQTSRSRRNKNPLAATMCDQGEQEILVMGVFLAAITAP